LDRWDRSVEDQIRDAMERGLFDNLRGKGEPLDLSVSPFEHPLAGTFRRILRDAGSSHPLIEARRALQQEIEAGREQLRRAWRGYLRFGSEQAWRAAEDAFRARIRQLNREIKLYNLKAPAPPFHLHVVDCDAEIRAMCSESPPE
jgi:DnaJ family protein C protein 28